MPLLYDCNPILIQNKEELDYTLKEEHGSNLSYVHFVHYNDITKTSLAWIHLKEEFVPQLMG